MGALRATKAAEMAAILASAALGARVPPLEGEEEEEEEEEAAARVLDAIWATECG